MNAVLYPETEKLTTGQIEKALGEAPLERLPVLRIAVLRNVMIEPAVPYLRFLALRMGYRAEVALGEYDNVVQESLGAKPELLDRTDCVIVFSYLETLASRLVRNYARLSRAEIDADVAAVHQYINTSLAGIRRQTDALVLWHAFQRPLHPSLGILDSQSRDGQRALVDALNDHLCEQLRAAKNAYLVDTDLCAARLGAKAFYDSRYWHIGKAPYSREGLKELASEAFKFIRPRMGKSKKCLVLDCDNTLWGGVLGEEGTRGIQLGSAYPGSAYREFQEEILNLYHRGILLALCTKNNEADVWEVFDGHPDMVLRRDHIAAAQINWLDKAANLRQIAKDLNIGLDSLVFVDDSAFEANLVRSLVPEVEVILLPTDRAVDYRAILASCGLFEGLTLSHEDRTRGAMVAADKKRQALATGTPDLETYYRSLEMRVELRFAEGVALPRVAQQTQKTNQFNLTTRRYSEAEIEKLARAQGSDVVCLTLADTFGELGIVGSCVLKYTGRSALIDTLLMSCRALGRGVEDVFLMEVLDFVKRKGLSSVVGEYIPTAKNQQVESFYARHGFAPAGGEGGARRFSLDLARLQWRRPAFFKQIDSHLA